MDGHWEQRLKSALIESVFISFSIFLKKGVRETSSGREDVSLVAQRKGSPFMDSASCISSIDKSTKRPPLILTCHLGADPGGFFGFLGYLFHLWG